MNERKIDVFMDGRMVGTLAETIDRRVAFAYSDEWICRFIADIGNSDR